MRVPWLQVTDEAFELGDQLERTLNAPENWGFRAVGELWRWGLSLGTNDAPPDGICASPRAARLMAAAMRWRGDLDELVDVLCDMGLIERLDVGLRVKGTDRYAATWLKNQRRRVPGGDRPVPGDNPPGNREKPERQTQTQTQKKQQLPSSPDGDQLAGEVLVGLWNEHAPPECPRVQKLTDKRKAASKARWRDTPDVERWRAAIDSMHVRPFLRGDNDRKWVADFDWLLQPDTLTKIEEGKYRGTSKRREEYDPNQGIIRGTTEVDDEGRWGPDETSPSSELAEVTF